jgi:ATP-dependent RNA helicase DDX27
MLESLSKYLVSQGDAGFSSLACFGGSSIKQAKRDLQNAPDFIVATTGRLIDHCKNTSGFSLEDVEVLVLDEADRLLEMGFKDELKTILEMCKSRTR